MSALEQQGGRKGEVMISGHEIMTMTDVDKLASRHDLAASRA